MPALPFVAVRSNPPDRAMTPRERFIAAFERKPLTGRVPHFELVFFLTMEAFGKVHPAIATMGNGCR